MTVSNQINPDTNYVSRFSLGKERAAPLSPEYDVPYGHPSPPLTASGNLTYLQLIDLICYLWGKSNPEVPFVPMGNRESYDPEKGNIVYSLESKRAAQNNAKPQHRQDVVKTDAGDFKGSIYIQSFDHLIEFTAIHYNPRTAEELLESFEDFMMVITPEIKYFGAEEFTYNRRLSGRDQTRFGNDIASRSVMYLAVLQKMIIIRPDILESIRIDVRILREQGTPESNESLFTDVFPPV